MPQALKNVQFLEIDQNRNGIISQGLNWNQKFWNRPSTIVEVQRNPRSPWSWRPSRLGGSGVLEGFDGPGGFLGFCGVLGILKLASTYFFPLGAMKTFWWSGNQPLRLSVNTFPIPHKALIIKLMTVRLLTIKVSFMTTILLRMNLNQNLIAHISSKVRQKNDSMKNVSPV